MLSFLKCSKAPFTALPTFKVSASSLTLYPSCNHHSEEFVLFDIFCTLGASHRLLTPSLQRMCYDPHFTNEETEAQGEKVACPKPTAPRGQERSCAFWNTIPLDCPQDSHTSPSQSPHPLQAPLGIPALGEMTSLGSHSPAGTKLSPAPGWMFLQTPSSSVGPPWSGVFNL